MTPSPRNAEIWATRQPTPSLDGDHYLTKTAAGAGTAKAGRDDRTQGDSMELGRTNELTILTPNERAWIERALGPAGRNVMADAALKAGLGRRLDCETPAGNHRCGRAATHFYVGNDDRLHAHCEHHWREMDPNDTLRLLGRQAASDIGTGQNG